MIDILIVRFARTRAFSNIIRDVEIVVPEQELTAQQQVELREIAEGCGDVLRDLDDTLGKYHELGTDSRGVGRKARRIWKRLKLEPEDIKDLRGRIVVNTGILNTFLVRLSK